MQSLQPVHPSPRAQPLHACPLPKPATSSANLHRIGHPLSPCLQPLSFVNPPPSLVHLLPAEQVNAHHLLPHACILFHSLDRKSTSSPSRHPFHPPLPLPALPLPPTISPPFLPPHIENLHDHSLHSQFPSPTIIHPQQHRLALPQATSTTFPSDHLASISATDHHPPHTQKVSHDHPLLPSPVDPLPRHLQSSRSFYLPSPSLPSCLHLHTIFPHAQASSSAHPSSFP